MADPEAGAAAAPFAGAGPGSFEHDTQVRLREEDGAVRRYEADVGSGWRAGRGPHGGYLAAMLLRALTDAVGDASRAPRSLTIHYTRAPETGPIEIATTLERAGRSLSTLSARMEQDGRTAALALAAFSTPWSGPHIDDLRPPAVDPPAALPAPGEHPLAASDRVPPMARHIVFQQRMGGRPFAGEPQPMEVGGWLGHAEERAIDSLSLAFFVDALIPDPFMRLEEPNAAPTVDLTVHFRATVAGPGEGTERLCLTRTRCRLIQEGFFEEDGVVWSADGRVLAQSRQLALLLPMK